MMARTEKKENFKIELDDRRILRLIGYKKKLSEINDSLKKIFEEEKNKLDSLLHPASIYTIINYEETNKHPIFKDAQKVAFCISTIGSSLETEISELIKKNELLRALILDALGSEAVEKVTRQSDKILAQKARSMNLWPSKRFSPGYKYWKLEEQQFIFHILPADQIGVHLHQESWMMTPRKSVSFRINFYKDKNLSTRKNFWRGKYD